LYSIVAEDHERALVTLRLRTMHGINSFKRRNSDVCRLQNGNSIEQNERNSGLD